MTRDEAVALVNRDWGALRSNRFAYWAERYRREGGQPARLAASVLYQHARRLGVPIDDERQRADDLRAHVHLRERLDRAARAVANR